MPDYDKRKSVLIYGDLLTCDYGGALISAPEPKCRLRAKYTMDSLNYCMRHVHKVPIYLQDRIRPIMYMR